MADSKVSHLEHHLNDQVSHSKLFFWHRARWNAVRAFLPKQSPFVLLDIGAGAGMTGHYLKKNFPQAKYNFIEPIVSLESYLNLEFGKENNYSDQEEYLGISRILLLDVLEHQEDDKFFINKIIAKMEPGSRLIITVPALAILWSNWDKALGHFRRYTQKNLLSLFDDQPVSVIYSSYLFPELIPLALIRKLKGWFAISRHGTSAEFPHLPNWANELLFGFSNLFAPLSPKIPFGTSLLAVFQKN